MWYNLPRNKGSLYYFMHLSQATISRVQTCIVFIAVGAGILLLPSRASALTTITTCGGLQNIEDNLSEDYVLGNDIDCSGVSNFTPIGSFASPFTGTLDGQGYTINNLSVSTTYAGMFGSVGTGAVIEKLGFENPDIDGHTYSGVLASYLQGGTVSKVYVGDGTLACANAYCGGLVGYMFNASSVVSSSYSNVDINDGSYVGGIVGRFSTGTIDTVYATGRMTGSNKYGILGLIDSGVTPSVSRSYFDEDTTTAADNSYGTATTTAAMMTQSTFSGWNFSVAGNGTIGEWIMAGYPHLQMEHRSTITNITELQLIAVDRTDDYTLAGDIDASSTATWNAGAGFVPIGDNSAQFTGSIDGNGYTISDLYIDRPSEEYVTLIGYLNAAGSMTHIKMTGADLTGDRTVTGFVGVSYGSLSKLSFSGNISGNSVLAGITGENGGTLTECQTAGTITGTVNSYYLGGIAGNNVGTLTNSYSSMDISGKDLVGGLAGDNYNDGTIQYSYAVGAISGTTNVGGLVGRNASSFEDEVFEGTVESSFYNSTTSGQSDTDKGTGKTTAQMKALTTFTDTGTSGLDVAWDFVGTPYDDEGTSSIWEMDPAINSGYPVLAWLQSDSTAPSAVTSLGGSVTGGDDVILSWTNPTASDFVSVTVRRSTSAYPSTISSGTAVVSGTPATSVTQTSLDDAVYYYSVFALDNTGNVSAAATTSVTIDTTPPELTLVGSASVTLTRGSTYTDAGATAADNIDGDITGNISTSNTVNSNVPGTYTVTYAVSDSTGNAATTISRTVTVTRAEGGGRFVAPAAIGTGASSRSVSMGDVTDIGSLDEAGINLLAYLGSGAFFTVNTSGSQDPQPHRLTVSSLDITPGHVTAGITVSSEPQTVLMAIGDVAVIDLDGDAVPDMQIRFADLWVNRVELTLRAIATSGSATSAVIENGSPTVADVCQPLTVSRELQLTMNGEDVKALQAYLNSHGALVAQEGVGSPGQETTYFGSLTQAALMTFQGMHGLVVSGKTDAATRAALACNPIVPSHVVSTTSTSFDRDLSVGMTGDDVKALQVYLNTNGFPLAASGIGSQGEETVYFGELTRRALVLFQEAHGLPAWGYFGPLTRAFL